MCCIIGLHKNQTKLESNQYLQSFLFVVGTSTVCAVICSSGTEPKKKKKKGFSPLIDDKTGRNWRIKGSKKFQQVAEPTQSS